jgi:non-heme chloroperoxidase
MSFIAWAAKFVGILALLVSGNAAAELRYSIVEGHGGVPLNVVEAGERGAPGILLIHGFAQSYVAFKKQLNSDLSNSFHLVSFDMRGHGASAKPWKLDDYADSEIWADDVNAVIVATELDRPLLVGWSYGGYVAVDYVRHYGTEGIAGINMVGSVGGLVSLPPPTMTEDMKRMFANSERSRSLNLFDNLIAAQATGELLSTPNMDDDELAAAFAMQVMMPAYARRAMRGRNLDNTGSAQLLTLPVLLTRGTEDTVVPAAGITQLLAELPEGTSSTYLDTGHLPFFEQSERFNTELVQFFKDSTEGRVNDD